MLKKRIKELVKNNWLFYFPIYVLRNIEGAVYHILFLCPINKKRVVLTSFYGKSYSDQPRALSEALKNYSNVEVIWLAKNVDQPYDKVKFVKYNSIAALYYLATAHIWIDNCRKAYWLRKRKGQYYIQTWHGGIGLKKVEKGAASALPKYYIANAKNDSKMADLFLSSCKWSTDNYRENFWYDGEILEAGMPRSDIFFNAPEKIYYEKVCQYYHVQPGVRFALYAPTFRVDQSTECYRIDYARLKDALEKKWSGEWKIIVRLHPNVQKNQNFMTYDENVLNGSTYEEINELIIASDLLISDYSSCMFDAMLAGKHVLLYATDIDAYNKDRGMCFTFDELPFPLAVNNDELMKAILEFNDETYKKEIDAFEQRVQIYEDGHATERVVERILQVIKD